MTALIALPRYCHKLTSNMTALISLLRFFSPVSAYISTEMNMFKDCMGQRGLQGLAVNVVNDMLSMLSTLCCPCFRCISTVHAVNVVNAMVATLSTRCCQCCQCISTVHAVHVVNAVFHAVNPMLFMLPTRKSSCVVHTVHASMLYCLLPMLPTAWTACGGAISADGSLSSCRFIPSC